MEFISALAAIITVTSAAVYFITILIKTYKMFKSNEDEIKKEVKENVKQFVKQTNQVKEKMKESIEKKVESIPKKSILKKSNSMQNKVYSDESKSSGPQVKS